MTDQLLTIPQVAEGLAVSEKTVRRAIRIPERALHEYLDRVSDACLECSYTLARTS